MADFTEPTRAIQQELACTSCGAILKFKPGTRHLSCEYCHAEQEIAAPPTTGTVEEISLEDFLSRQGNEEERLEVATVKCEACGATTTLGPNISADRCPFCAANLVVKSGTTSTIHKPQYLLPFGVTDQQAGQNFKRWLSSLWFAPGDLKHHADTAAKLAGIYLPFWTFDCETEATYTGQRGEDYYVSESYTAVENGREVTRTRQVRHTRWYPAAGTVTNVFDDILIEATRSLNSQKLRALEPWDLKQLAPYDDKFLSGFRTETYAVDVKAGYQEAKGRMEPVIRDTICRDIGGDRQIIHFVNTTYHRPTFKHILLPVWVSAYRYQNKVYQFLINARTGEVQGERPYSAWKIAGAIILGLIIILTVYLFSQK